MPVSVNEVAPSEVPTLQCPERSLIERVMHELEKSARIAFVLLTLAIAAIYLTAVAAWLTTHLGAWGYALTVVAAPVLSPAVLGLPWFHAWANDAEISRSVLLLWLLWCGALVGVGATWLELRARSRRLRSGDTGGERRSRRI